MITLSPSMSILGKMLIAGFIWLLLGIFLAPTSKIYHQLIITFFWLPGLFIFIKYPSIRVDWDKRLLILFGLIAGWSIISVVWGGDFHQVKEVFYVALNLNAFLVLATLYGTLLWRLLAVSAFVGGLLGWVSVFYCYVILGNELSFRCVGIGQLEHTILASHVMGIMCLCLINLRSYLPRILQKSYWVIPCSGYLAFMVMSRTKGTLIAMIVCLCLFYLWKPNRRSLMLAASTAVISGLALLLFPHELLRDGFSYRPELLQLAISQFLEHPWLGIGMDTKYVLTVPSSGIAYKHAHNFYAHLAVQLGMIGLLLWLALVAGVAHRSWQYRKTPQGRTLCALLCFSGIALFTDGMGPWFKPREEWFSIWLPIMLGLTLKLLPLPLPTARMR